MAVRKLKQVEANDGSYGGKVLAAFDAMERSELDKLAHGMAFDRATETIDAAGVYTKDRWTDISPESLEPYEVDAVKESVRYLEMRGLLERHPDHPHWVQVRDESEATA